ncbi:MAG: tetratricopeptide repeat protein, partial [Elusimicrobia bacterium]|nr:tetratricopeptide repeat protein [Elusimicrobiota bacterium]
ALAAGSAAWARRAPDAAVLHHRSDLTAWDYGTALMDALPRGALVLDPDDPTAFTLSYLAGVDGRRSDIVPLLYFRTRWGYESLRTRHPELLPKREILSGQELRDVLVSYNLAAGRPLFVDLPQKAPIGTPSLPEGLAYRLFKTPPTPAERAAALARAEAEFDALFMRPARADAGFFSRHAAAYWSSALNNTAIEAERLGRLPEAERLYERALAFDPTLEQAWNNWGNCAFARGDTKAAEGRYLAALALKEDSGVRYNLGRAYLLAGSYPEAEAAYQRVIGEGGPLEAVNDLGLVRLRTGHADEAARIWEGLLRAKPDFGLAYYNLALAYQKLGRRADAARAVALWKSFASTPADKAEADAWLRRLEK